MGGKSVLSFLDGEPGAVGVAVAVVELDGLLVDALLMVGVREKLVVGVLFGAFIKPSLEDDEHISGISFPDHFNINSR